MKSKKSQVWVETAIYTVIGLSVIAILLTIVTPQMEKIKDKGIIDQTINALEILDNKIEEASQIPGSIRIVDFKIAKGSLEFNSSFDSIVYVLENSRLELSEVGEEIKQGDIILKTESQGSKFKIILKLTYDNKDITYDGADSDKILNAGSTPYKIQISNIGDNGLDDKVHLDFGLLWNLV